MITSRTQAILQSSIVIVADELIPPAIPPALWPCESHNVPTLVVLSKSIPLNVQFPAAQPTTPPVYQLYPEIFVFEISILSNVVLFAYPAIVPEITVYEPKVAPSTFRFLIVAPSVTEKRPQPSLLP